MAGQAMIRIEWVEIPAGQFASGLSREQKADLSQRLRADFGIDRLPQREQALLEGMFNKSYDDYSLGERKYWEHLSLTESPLLAYENAMLSLRNIPDQRMLDVPVFYCARFPITHAQADHFYMSTLAQQLGWTNKQRPIDANEAPDRPEMFLYWEQADVLAHWLGGRLPSVAEWEKAARGIDGKLYPWGNEWNSSAGNFGTSESRVDGEPEKRRGRVTAVDAYPEGASPYGVMDMSGNLSEWTASIDLHYGGPMLMGYSIKDMPDSVEWFWSLPVLCLPGSFKFMWYIGCRPVLTQWGRHLWPGYRPELEQMWPGEQW